MERWNAEILLCSPIPLSIATVLARSSSNSASSGSREQFQGVVTLCLRGVSSSVNRCVPSPTRLNLCLMLQAGRSRH